MAKNETKKQICVATTSFRGAPHGHTTYQYNEGDPVPAELAEEMISLKKAKYIDAPEPKKEKGKDKKGAPENKSIEGGKE